jgi:uncharacterized DUF497 family protein
MKNPVFSWSEAKNKILKENRNVGFDDVVKAIHEGDLLDIIPSPSPSHEGQCCFIVKINNYAHIVPYVENNKETFLKTIYPSRKFTKLLLNK